MTKLILFSLDMRRFCNNTETKRKMLDFGEKAETLVSLRKASKKPLTKAETWCKITFVTFCN